MGRIVTKEVGSIVGQFLSPSRTGTLYLGPGRLTVLEADGGGVF